MTDKHKPETTQDRVRHAASDAYASAGDAARRAGQGLEANPLGVLVGGLAVGAIVGALIPRSDREKTLLAPAGRKLGETVRAAVQSAREAGFAELDQRGLTKSGVKDQARGLVDGLGKAVTAAGTAAAQTAQGKAAGANDDGEQAATGA